MFYLELMVDSGPKSFGIQVDATKNIYILHIDKELESSLL